MRGRHPTNRWTGATGSDFRIKRDPAKLLGSAVARSTQPLGVFISVTRTLLIAILLIIPGASCAQPSKATLGWDLSYKTVLDANHVAPSEWLSKWIGPNYQSPARRWISSWNHGPIQSSILVEFPAPHAGERIIMWLVRTKDEAYYYERAEGNPLYKDDKPPRESHETLDAQSYDNFFSIASRWQQGAAVKPENTPNGGVSGYDGVFSTTAGTHDRCCSHSKISPSARIRSVNTRKLVDFLRP
jgi:hypothetical protein